MSSGNDRLAIVAALEAFEVGDQEYAVTILLGAVEDGPAERPYVCDCGARFEWPGLRDAHRDKTGCGGLARAA